MQKKLIGNKNGFTLIELLIVVAIIGILIAVATPFYLGQREKAKIRAIESCAKRGLPEIQSWLDSYIAGEPFVALDINGTETCFEPSILVLGRRCENLYPDVSSTKIYTVGDLNGLVNIILKHHAGKNEYSPFNPTQSLFVSNKGIEGTIVLETSGSRTIRIHAYGTDVNHPILDTFIIAR